MVAPWFGDTIGVEPDGLELAHVEIELFAGDLQQAGGVTLAQLAFAEEHGGGVVRMYGDPAVDPARIGRTCSRAGCGRGDCRHARHGKADDERAALDEVAAGERGGGMIEHRMVVHGVPPAMVREATWIAFMILG